MCNERDPVDENVAGLVPCDASERHKETVEVLSDTDVVRALSDTEAAVVGRAAIRALVADRDR